MRPRRHSISCRGCFDARLVFRHLPFGTIAAASAERRGLSPALIQEAWLLWQNSQCLVILSAICELRVTFHRAYLSIIFTRVLFHPPRTQHFPIVALILPHSGSLSSPPNRKQNDTRFPPPPPYQLQPQRMPTRPTPPEIRDPRTGVSSVRVVTLHTRILLPAVVVASSGEGRGHSSH